MNLYAKDMEAIGFKGSNIFQSRWHHFYYRAVPKKKTVYIVDALDEIVEHFTLSIQEWRAFKRGTLKLIPVGCCNAAGGRALEDPAIDFKGDLEKIFKTKKKFLQYLDELCASTEQECV